MNPQEQLRGILASPSSLNLSSTQQESFVHYYELILGWNRYLHLTTLTSPSEFAERHILESFFGASYIHSSIREILDIGSGGGIPGIPIAILRPDLSITLNEANKKKAIFLKEVATAIRLDNVCILNKRFEDINNASQDVCITSRALDQFSQVVPSLMNLIKSTGQALLFGNESLLELIERNILPGWSISAYPIPKTQRRLLISLLRFT